MGPEEEPDPAASSAAASPDGLNAPERHDDLVAIQIEWRAVGQKVVFFRSSDLLYRTHLDDVVGGDGEAANGGERRIAEHTFDLVAGAREGIVRVVEDEGRHIVKRQTATDGETRNHGNVNLDGPPGEGVNRRHLVRDFEADLFCRGARNEIERQRGIKHPTARSRIDKDRNIDEAQRIGGDLKPERVTGIDGRGRVVLGQRQHLERHLDLVLLVGRQLGMEAGIERLIGRGGLGPVAQAQVVLGQRRAQQLFVRRVAASRHRVNKRLQQLHRLLKIVGAVGQHAAI